MSRFLSHKDDVGKEKALMAIVAFPTLEQARAYMEAQGYAMTLPHLEQLQGRHRDRIVELREEHAQRIEEQFATSMIDGARLADYVTDVAVAKAAELMPSVTDPVAAARIARDLQQVASQKIEKAHAIQGKPSVIIEHRSFEEITNALVAMNVARVVDSSATEIEEEP